MSLIVIGDLVLHSPALAQYIVSLSLGLATATTLAWIAKTKPKGKQTSYFQPVRIPSLKREFVSGIVTSIGFAFTNIDYARAFAGANKAVTLEQA